MASRQQESDETRGLIDAMFGQGAVIAALVIRDVKSRFGMNFMGFGWAILTPVIWIGLLVAVFHVLNRFPPLDTDTVSFIATGMVPYVIFRTTVTSMNRALATNRHLRFFAQVGHAEIFSAAAFVELFVGLLVYLLIVQANYLIAGHIEARDPLLMATGVALACGLGAGLGRILALLTQLSDTVARIWPTLLRPMFWISGIFFTANELPEFALDILQYNPLLHAIEVVRTGAFFDYESDTATLWYPAVWVIVLHVVSMALAARLSVSAAVR